MSGGERQSGALVAEIMAAVVNVPADRVRVTGDGSLAGRLRSRGLDGESTQPALAVVETTGLETALTKACGEVADGGLVVLAADAPEPIAIDLYRDVHRRGLVLVGVSGRGASGPSGDHHPADARE
jgi:hypothetical protein